MEQAKIQRYARQITLAEWNEVIASHPTLTPAPDRVGINPFTKEKELFSGEGIAYYVVNGKPVGNAVLEDGMIRTSGVHPDVCEQIARSLQAVVVEDDCS